MPTLITIRQLQVIGTNRGWVTYKDSEGVEHKARSSKLQILPDDAPLFGRRVGNKRYDCRKYQAVTTAAGNNSMHSGDVLAKKLHNVELLDVYKMASEQLELSMRVLQATYSHLNDGMQRMVLGNRIRAALRRQTAQ